MGEFRLLHTPKARLAGVYVMCLFVEFMFLIGLWAMTNRSNILGRDIYPMAARWAARCVVCAGPREVVDAARQQSLGVVLVLVCLFVCLSVEVKICAKPTGLWNWEVEGLGRGGGGGGAIVFALGGRFWSSSLRLQARVPTELREGNPVDMAAATRASRVTL